MKFFRLAALGAALYYLVDRRRRAQFLGRIRQLVGNTRSSLPGMERTPLDDQTLKAKIESEVFREAEAPKGEVNVNVEEGVVYLRGQLDDRSLIEDLERRVRSVHGVERVENLLHTPGTEAPTHS